MKFVILIILNLLLICKQTRLKQKLKQLPEKASPNSENQLEAQEKSDITKEQHEQYEKHEIEKSYTNYNMKSAIEKTQNTTLKHEIKKGKPTILIHFDKDLINKPLGGFKVFGSKNPEDFVKEKYNVIYPSDPENYLQSQELTRVRPQDFSLNFQRTSENMDQLYQYTNQLMPTTDLMNGMSHRPLQIMVNKEQEYYDDQMQQFSGQRVRDHQNKLISDYQKYFLMRKTFPNAQMSGEENYQNTNVRKSFLRVPFLDQSPSKLSSTIKNP